MRALAATVRAELFRAARKRRVYALAALHWLLLPALMLLLGRLLETNLRGSFVDEGQAVGLLVQELASPYGIARAALIGPALLNPTFYIIAIALLAGFLIGEEKSQNMWKTVLTTQPNRMAVLTGKLLVAMILLGVLLAGAFAAGALFGLGGMLFLDTTPAGDWAGLARLFLLQWLFAAAAVAFAFLMIFIARNVSLGMVLVFFLPALVEGLYSLYRATVGLEPVNRLNALFQALELRQVVEELPRYFFTANLYAPSRQPFLEVLHRLGGQPAAEQSAFAMLLRTDISLGHAATVLTVYTLSFLALLAWLFVRRDVE